MGTLHSQMSEAIQQNRDALDALQNWRENLPQVGELRCSENREGLRMLLKTRQSQRDILKEALKDGAMELPQLQEAYDAAIASEVNMVDEELVANAEKKVKLLKTCACLDEHLLMSEQHPDDPTVVKEVTQLLTDAKDL